MPLELLETLRDGRIAGAVVARDSRVRVDADLASAIIAAGQARRVVMPYQRSRGLRAVLFGDSMTSQHYADNTPAASYDPDSGILTLTSLSNPVASGWTGIIFNRGYVALRRHREVVLTYVSDTSVTCFIGRNLEGLPAGALAGTTFLRIPTKQAANGWFTWLQMRLNHPFELVYNGAQSGDTSADCLARLAEHCLAFMPEVVLMQLPGINDMPTATFAGLDEETTFANVTAIIDQIIGSGAFLVALSITPVGTGEAHASLQNMARVIRLNRRFAEYLRALRNNVFVDAYGAIVSPTSTTGLAASGLLKSTDQIHYAIPGAIAVESRVRAALNGRFQGADTRPRSTIDCYLNAAVTASSVTRAGNLVTFNATAHGFLVGEMVGITGATPSDVNGWFPVMSASANAFTFIAPGADGTATGTIRASRGRNLFNNPVLATGTGGAVSAGVTGTAASLLSVRNQTGSAGGLTGVASVVAHPDGYGSMQQLVCSAASANDLPGFSLNTTSLLNAEVAAGREYVFEADWRIASANWANTPVNELMARLIVTVDGTLFSSFALNTYDGLPAAGSLSADQALHIRTQPLLIPPGTISQFYFQVYARAAGSWTSNLTQLLGRIGIHQLNP